MKKILLSYFAPLAMIAAALFSPVNSWADNGIASISTNTAAISLPSATVAILQEKPADPPLVNTTSVSLGALGVRDDFGNRGVIAFTELEKRLTRRFALFARLGRIEYKPNGNTGDYGEGGRGNGIELGGRVYLALKENVNFYLGFGAGGWRLNWYWKDEEGTPFETTGRRRSRVDSVQIHAGWKFRLGQGTMYFNPSIQIGSFFPRQENDPMEFNEVYTSIGLAVGKAW